MSIKGLYLVINKQSQSPKALIQLCKKALLGGVNAIQFRDKNPVSAETVYTAKELAYLCQQFQIPFIINDHVKLAQEISADGIHIGQNDMPIEKVKQVVGGNVIIGVTVSNSHQAKLAASSGADYLGCGHIYPTKTKQKKGPPIGICGLEKVVKSVSIPVIAIGGLNSQHIHAVLKTGAAGIAIASAIADHPFPTQACQNIQSSIKKYRERSCIQKS